MPFNKIAELGMELGKAQLILNSRDEHIKHLEGQVEDLQNQLVRAQQVQKHQVALAKTDKPGSKAAS